MTVIFNFNLLSDTHKCILELLNVLKCFWLIIATFYLYFPANSFIR